MCGDHLSQELLLLLQWHALHRLSQAQFLLVRHEISNLIKLFLQFVPVLVSLLLNLFLCLLLVPLLLLVVHRLDNLLDLRSDLLQSLMSICKLRLIHIYSALIGLKVAYSLI